LRSAGLQAGQQVAEQVQGLALVLVERNSCKVGLLSMPSRPRE
jgi:hypothetical protein